MIRLSAVCALLACVPVSAQVEGPLLGYLPDGPRLRPVFGIPASASIGAAGDYGSDFARIVVSPRQDFAVVSTADSGAVFVAVPGQAMVPIPGAGFSPERILLSPSGSAAVLWFGDIGRIQVVTGLPGAPVLRNADASFLSGSPDALAVSDGGLYVAGSWADGLWSFGTQSQVARLPFEQRASSLAFFAGRQDLAVATVTQVFSITDIGGAATVSKLYEGSAMAPVGLALSADNRMAVMPEASGMVVSVDLASGSAARFDCGCSPEGIFSMGRSVFRFTGLAGSVFRVFDASTGDMFYVPLAPAQGGGQ